jgi:hypothetical protein
LAVVRKLPSVSVPFINERTKDISRPWRDYLESIAPGTSIYPWTSLDFTNSELSDIENRPHADLQLILPADDTDTDTDLDKHVSNNMVKGYNDHVLITNANPHGTDHDQINNIGEADETSADATKDKHVSNLQMKTAYDDIDDNTTDIAANLVSIKSTRVLQWLTMQS